MLTEISARLHADRQYKQQDWHKRLRRPNARGFLAPVLAGGLAGAAAPGLAAAQFCDCVFPPWDGEK